MTGWTPWPREERERVGREVAKARAKKPPIEWKELERRFGRTTHHLRLYMKMARAALRSKKPTNAGSLRFVADASFPLQCGGSQDASE